MTDQELKDLVAGLAVKSDRVDAQIAATAKVQDQIGQELKGFIAGSAVKSDRLDAQLAASRLNFDAQLTASKVNFDAQLTASKVNFDAQLTASKVNFDAQMNLLAIAQAEAKAEVAEMSRVIKEVGKRMGSMASNQGAVAEEFFFNSLQAKPELGGVRYDDVFLNVHSFSGKLQGEYDVVMVNGKSVALVEIKYIVHPSDIEKTVKGIHNYRRLYPEHKDFDIYGAIAGFKIAPDAVTMAKTEGLMVLKQVGDVLEVDAGQAKRF